MHRMQRVYTVEAYNLSHASENKIHDDAVAQKLGFSGGLVPGVEVYAYACHPAVRRWGRDWLERGQMECRFLKPVYDGHLAVVTAKASDGGLDIKREEPERAVCRPPKPRCRKARRSAADPCLRAARAACRPPSRR